MQKPRDMAQPQPPHTQTAPIPVDLRESGTLSADLLRRLDEIQIRDFSVFNQFVADLSRGRERNIDWWVCRPATRNNHVSLLFVQCMQLALVRDLLGRGLKILVQTDSSELAATLAREAFTNLTVTCNGVAKVKLRRTVRTLTNVMGSIFNCAAAAFAAWRTRDGAGTPNDPLTIINTFVSHDTSRTGRFTDRYYPGLMEALSPEERARCCYLPVFYRVRNYLATFRILRAASEKFLFYEDHLTLRDYGFAFGHWWRARMLLGAAARYAGFDVGPLVDADIRGGRFTSIVVRALLAYRFHAAAASRGLRIRTVLDWYEGLDYNHAIAAAINWHAPRTALTGFRSAGSLYYMSCTPAPHEVANSVVPQTFAVVGTRLASDIQMLCPGLHVIPAPGMRYRRLASLTRKTPGPEQTVLIALPLSPELAAHCIRIIAAARLQMRAPPQHWLVKCHPTLPERDVLALTGGTLPAGLTFVQDDFYTMLTRVDLVAGVGSSALMESVSLGIPTLCLAAGNAPTEIPVPAWVDTTLSRVTYDAQQTAEALAEMIPSSAPPESSTRLHAMLLGAVDTPAMRRLLDLPPLDHEDMQRLP
jgi:hypothetical protein